MSEYLASPHPVLLPMTKFSIIHSKWLGEGTLYVGAVLALRSPLSSTGFEKKGVISMRDGQGEGLRE